jgi:hypothetical protein
MSLHLKRGLIAFLVAFGVVLITGARDIYFDPPVDVPSVGYWAYWLLVKAVLAIGIGFGLTAFAVVFGGSWLIANIKRKSVKIGLLGLLLLFALPASFLVGYKFQSTYTRCDYPLPPTNK